MTAFDVKSVYSMGTAELRKAFKLASRDRTASAKYWDALMYRSSVLRSDLSMNEVSAILDSLVEYPKFSSPLFVKYLVDPLPTKGSSVMDAACILRSVRRLALDEKLISETDSRIQQIIAEKLSNKISVPDVDILARVLSQSPELNSMLSQRMRSIIANLGIEKLKSASTILSVLKFLVLEKKSSSTVSFSEEEPFFETVSDQSRDIELLKNVFAQTVSLASKFNAKDVIDFSFCLAELVKQDKLGPLGHPSAGPILGILARAVRRNLKSFKPNQLALLMTVDVDLDRTLLMEECKYRVREFKPENCVKILNSPFGISRDLKDALIARLHKFDACRELNIDQLISVCSKLDPESPLSKSFLQTMIPLTRKASESEMKALSVIFKTHGLDFRPS